jgi:hypothetical protein
MNQKETDAFQSGVNKALEIMDSGNRLYGILMNPYVTSDEITAYYNGFNMTYDESKILEEVA